MTKKLSLEESHDIACNAMVDLLNELEDKNANMLQATHGMLGVAFHKVFELSPTRSEIAHIIGAALIFAGKIIEEDERECPKCKEEREEKK